MGKDEVRQGNKSGKKNLKKAKSPAKEGGFDPRLLDDHSKKIIAVRKLMREREGHRQKEDYAASDRLRTELEGMGVLVQDQADGPSGWKFKDGSTRKLQAGTKVPDNATKVRQSELKKKLETIDTSKKLKVKKLKKQIEAEGAAGKSSETQRNVNALSALTNSNPGKRVVRGVTIEDKEIGTGAPAEKGKRLKMHYTGKLASNGKIFDSSIGKRPFTFKLARGEVIAGWDIGCAGMRVGGRRTLHVPAPLGYGKSGAGNAIPPNAALVFDVTLLDVSK
jgi:FKBP-type peptidyl-prolyl cis-trans isomerase